MVIYLVAPPSGFLFCFLDENILLEGLSTIQQAKVMLYTLTKVPTMKTKK
jgi:hypothetical protein